MSVVFIVVENESVENLVFIIDFHLECEITDIGLHESFLELHRLYGGKQVHHFILILVQVLFLNFFVFDHFDRDKRGILDIRHDFGQRVVLSSFPEEKELKEILTLFHFGEADLVFVQLVDDRTRVVDGNGLPSLLAHLVSVAVVDHGVEILLNGVNLAHIFGRHDDFVVAVEREFDIVVLSVLRRHFKELNDAHDEVVGVKEDQLFADAVLNFVRLDILLIEFFIFLGLEVD